MGLILYIARGYLWLQTILCLVVVTVDFDYLSSSNSIRHVFGIFVVLGFFGLTGLAGNVLWDSRPVLARRLAMVASILPLFLLFPLPLLAFALIPYPKKDSEPEPAKGSSSSAWVTAINILLTLGATIFVVRSFVARNGTPPSLWVISLLGPVLLMRIVVHETGHILFALRNGLRPQLYMVGPVTWIRLQEGWRFEFLPRAYPSILGGRAGARCGDAEKLTQRIAWMVIGGPAAEGIAGLIFLAAFLTMDVARWPWLAHFVGFSAMFSFNGLLVNLLPFSFVGNESDGSVLLKLWSGGTERALMEARWNAGIPYECQTRFRDINPGPEVDPSFYHFTSWAMTHYYQFLDRGEYEQAGHWLDAARDAQQTKSLDRLFAYESAWYAAVHRADALARSRIPAHFHGLPIERFVILRAEAAMLRVEGKPDEDVIAEAKRHLDACETTGWTLLNNSLLEPSLARLSQALATESGQAITEKWQLIAGMGVKRGGVF